MTRKELIFRIVIISIPVLALFTAITMSVAWYINTIRTGTIDASTKNVAISYSITSNGNTAENVSTYNINNLPFFDIDSEYETKYFDSMCVNLSLTLTNESNSAMTYTVTFTSTKRVTEENNEAISKSYVACYFTNHPVNTIAELATNGTVSGNTVTYTTNNDTTFVASITSPSGALSASGDQNASVTLTLYLIGVQQEDEATNTDFLYSESQGARTLTGHQFTLTITAEPISNSVAEETQD